MDSHGSNTVSSPVTIYVRELPTVTITSPTNGQIFSMVSPMTTTNTFLNAVAVGDRATVTNVAFYIGTNYLGKGMLVSSNASFTLNTNAGTYAIYAVATDNTCLLYTSRCV